MATAFYIEAFRRKLNFTKYALTSLPAILLVLLFSLGLAVIPEEKKG